MSKLLTAPVGDINISIQQLASTPSSPPPPAMKVAQVTLRIRSCLLHTPTLELDRATLVAPLDSLGLLIHLSSQCTASNRPAMYNTQAI